MFYIVKFFEDLLDDDYFVYVRMEWYVQDLVDFFLFIMIGKEYIVLKDGIKGIVYVILIVDDIVEIIENDYYICLVLLYVLEDNVFFFEELEIDVEDDLDEREYESNRFKRSKRMIVMVCDFVYY